MVVMLLHTNDDDVGEWLLTSSSSSSSIVQGKEMAKSISAASYLEVSAKTRKGLDKVFSVAVHCVQQARGVTPAADGAASGADVAPVVVKKKNKSKGCFLM